MNSKCNDSRATEELIRLALNEEDEDAAWDAVVILHFCGNREVFEAVQKLGESNNPKERQLGVDILGQLGIDERVVEPLIKELSSGCVGILAVEAAKEIGDARLYSVLMPLQEWLNVNKKLLTEAINSCETK